MLELFFLVYLTRKIAPLAVKKGCPIGRWKLFVILAWFGSELVAGVIAFTLFPGEPLVYLGCAYGSAVGSYFLVREVLNRKPDQDDGWLARIGEEEKI